MFIFPFIASLQSCLIKLLCFVVDDIMVVPKKWQWWKEWCVALETLQCVPVCDIKKKKKSMHKVISSDFRVTTTPYGENFLKGWPIIYHNAYYNKTFWNLCCWNAFVAKIFTTKFGFWVWNLV